MHVFLVIFITYVKIFPVRKQNMPCEAPKRVSFIVKTRHGRGKTYLFKTSNLHFETSNVLFENARASLKANYNNRLLCSIYKPQRDFFF